MKNKINLTSLLVIVLSASYANGAENYVPPKTSFGVPDVQGIWTYETRTSLQRPEIYEGALEIDEETMLAKDGFYAGVQRSFSRRRAPRAPPVARWVPTTIFGSPLATHWRL